MDNPFNEGLSSSHISGSMRATAENAQRSPSANSRPGSQAAAPRVSKSNWSAAPSQRNTQSARKNTNAPRTHRSSSRRSTSTSRTGGLDHIRELPKYIDKADNKDRTPKPLTLRTVVASSQRGTSQDDYTPHSESSDNFLDRMSNASFSQHGWGTGSEASSCSQTPHNEPADTSDQDAASEQHGMGSMQEAHGQDAAAAQQQEQPLSEAQLDQELEICLQETKTIFHLNIPCTVVASESEEGKAVAATNQQYNAAVAAREAGEKLCCVEVQTLNPFMRSVHAQTSCTDFEDSGCQASTCDIAQTYMRAEEEEDMAAAVGDGAGGGMNVAAMAASVSAGMVPERDNRRTTAGTVASMMSGWRITHGESDSRRTTSRVSTANWMPGRQTGMLTHQNSSMSAFGAEASTTQSVSGGPAAGASPGDKDAAAAGPAMPDPEEPLRKLPGFLEALEVVDAALVQNVYLPQLLLYRDIKPSSISLPEPSTQLPHQQPSQQHASQQQSQQQLSSVPSTASCTTVTPRSIKGECTNQTLGDLYPEGYCSSSGDGGSNALQLQLLWRWQSPATQGRCCTCMSWNKAAPDLLAVGYGSFRFGDTCGGVVALWSLKNPTAPLWSFTTKAGATSLDWSAGSANLLAVGLHDGNVAIYDVRSRQPRPVMESVAGAGKHNDPVWKVKWVDRGADREEVLVSISTDGRVTQWSTAKGLEHTDLMKLKRLARQAPAVGAAKVAAAPPGTAGKPGSRAAAAVAGEQDALVSRHSGGMSFDFSNRDHRIYLAGTEDGWIHRCSSSYGDQYLESYRGHLGPVYALQVSPVRDDLFISCGGDWTVRLWQEGRPTPLLTFQTANEEVHDVQWATGDAVVFGAATAAGQLEVWDFSCSTTRPVAQYNCPTGHQATCLLFAPVCPVVVCGSSDGAVAVLRLHGPHVAPDMMDLQQVEARLEAALAANVIKTQPGGPSGGSTLSSGASAAGL